jgi:cupin fold WbuC family metalloprotein
MTTVIDRQMIETLVEDARKAPRRRLNRNFHPGDDYPAHRLLIAIEPDSYVTPHRHLSPNKDETLVVVRGSLGVLIFDDQGSVERSAYLSAGGDAIGVDIPHGVFHSIIALASGTVFFEAKAGPFVPVASEERADWAPAEGSADAVAYLVRMRAHFPQADQ